jgi:hypothetical protein
LLTVRRKGSGMAETIAASSQAEFSRRFSSSLGLEGESAFFKGELEATLDQARSRKTNTSFVQYNEQIYSWQLVLPSFVTLRKHMTEEARENFEGAMTPKELVKSYGTHYVARALVGARCSFSCSIDTSEFDSRMDMSATVKLAYNGMVARGSGEASAEQRTAMNEIKKSSTSVARILGGNERFAKRILDGEYGEWRGSIDQNMQVVDVAGGLIPISDLVEDETRRLEVLSEIQVTQSGHPLPDLPSIVLVKSFHTENPGRWFFGIDSAKRPFGFGARQLHPPFYAFKEPQEDTVPIYSKTKEVGGNRIFMLSLDREAGAGWPEGEVAFHAYDSPGSRNDRVRVCSYHNTARPAAHGWYYTTETHVNGWTQQDRHSFYVPKA